MKRMLLVLVVGAILFGGSAGLSLFLQKGAGDPASEGPEKGAKGISGGKGSKGAEGDSKGAPLPSRSLAKPTPESLSQLAASLRQKDELLQAKEQKLLGRQGQLDLIFTDIKTEQKTLETLRQEIAAEMKLLNQKMEMLELKSGDLEKKKTKLSDHAAEIKKTMFEVDSVEQNRIKQMAAMYNSMEPDTAGEILQQMADSGKMDMAVKILAGMQERQAARVLAQMADRGTVVLMLEKLKGLKKAGP